MNARKILQFCKRCGAGRLIEPLGSASGDDRRSRATASAFSRTRIFGASKVLREGRRQHRLTGKGHERRDFVHEAFRRRRGDGLSGCSILRPLVAIRPRSPGHEAVRLGRSHLVVPGTVGAGQRTRRRAVDDAGQGAGDCPARVSRKRLSSGNPTPGARALSEGAARGWMQPDVERELRKSDGYRNKRRLVFYGHISAMRMATPNHDAPALMGQRTLEGRAARAARSSLNRNTMSRRRPSPGWRHLPCPRSSVPVARRHRRLAAWDSDARHSGRSLRRRRDRARSRFSSGCRPTRAHRRRHGRDGPEGRVGFDDARRSRARSVTLTPDAC